METLRNTVKKSTPSAIYKIRLDWLTDSRHVGVVLVQLQTGKSPGKSHTLKFKTWCECGEDLSVSNNFN